MNEADALAIVRILISAGQTKEEALSNPAIPPEMRERVRVRLEKEENIILEPARFISEMGNRDWYAKVDKTQWSYWPAQKNFLLAHGWTMPAFMSLDDTTDGIMKKLPDPSTSSFDVRGLVLGYVQSGKTANFTATIAKAADCGYRLFIVLSGIDKGLRMQTQIRLNREIIGEQRFPGDIDHVPLPPDGRQWHSLTTADVNGDFNPGTINRAVLQGPQPVLMVVKKNGSVLKRLISWLKGTEESVLKEIPALIIDDEADLASIDTRGSYQTEDGPIPEDYEPPSVINGRIRELLSIFNKSVYLTYTATPFANILIPYDAYDPNVQNDLYPKDFIAVLPKPQGYFGAEELFGLTNPDGGGVNSGMGVIRIVPEVDVTSLEQKEMPRSLEDAMIGFILAGAARIQRGEGDQPVTMLIHTSFKIESHMDLEQMVRDKFSEFKNDWRYSSPPESLPESLPRFRDMWENDFRPLIRSTSPGNDVGFEEISKHIGQFIESVLIKTINSVTGAVLDYSRDPQLKSICIGGNRLSRGLTLEGLVSSYFVRDTPNYDTLMQMARWFGFRGSYVELTRIWTTKKLADEFASLAFVEHQLRSDIRIYEEMGLTPKELGMRIWQHPSMQVTSRLKMRFAKSITLSYSYSGTLVQTFKFPFGSPDIFIAQQEQNLRETLNLLSKVGKPTEYEGENPNRPVWKNVSHEFVTEYLSSLNQDGFPENFALDWRDIVSYIKKHVEQGELIRWTVSIRGRDEPGEGLGVTSWKVDGHSINQISRTRLTEKINSLGVITSPDDEGVGLPSPNDWENDQKSSRNSERLSGGNARVARPPEEGLLLIYPISRMSKPLNDKVKKRMSLFNEGEESKARDIIAIAISFPYSRNPENNLTYVTGRPGWRDLSEQS